MTHDNLIVDQFPRSNAYHPDWVFANASGGANSLWLTEWLASKLELKAGCHLGSNRIVGRRRPEVRLEEPISSVPSTYGQKPLLRTGS